MSSTSIRQIDQWRAVKSETEHLEFKEAKKQFSFDELLRYCVAIANEGGGQLLLGIENKPPRRVVGTAAFANIQKTALELLNKLHFRVDIEEIPHQGGRVLVFHVPPRPSRHPYELNGAYYMRSGESLVPMTPDQLKKIFHEPTAERTNGRGIYVLIGLVTVAVLLGYRFWATNERPPILHPPAANSAIQQGYGEGMSLPKERAPAGKAGDDQKFLGVRRPDETTTIPPGASAVISSGPLSEKQRNGLDRLRLGEDLARKHLNEEPEKLTVKDLFWTDFESPEDTVVRYSGFTIRNGKTGSVTHISSAVVDQLSAGVKLLAFYIPYTKETPDIAVSLAGMYRKPLDDYLEGMVVTGKAASGDSERLSSQNLILSNRVFVYHEAYLSPEQLIRARDAWKNTGIIVIFRSDDYLQNRKLQARIKLLERK